MGGGVFFFQGRFGWERYHHVQWSSCGSGFQVATPSRWDRWLPMNHGWNHGWNHKIHPPKIAMEPVFFFLVFLFFSHIFGKIMFHANNRWTKCGFGAAVEACKHPLPSQWILYPILCVEADILSIALWVSLPSRKLTYPPKMAFWRWFSFSQGGIC